MGLQFCRRDWQDVIARKEEDVILKKWGAVIMAVIKAIEVLIDELNKLDKNKDDATIEA